jgi:hypothetical protein
MILQQGVSLNKLDKGYLFSLQKRRRYKILTVSTVMMQDIG